MRVLKNIKERGQKELERVGIKKPTGLASYAVGAASTAGRGVKAVRQYTAPKKGAPIKPSVLTGRGGIFKKHTTASVRARPGLQGFMILQEIPSFNRPQEQAGVPKKKRSLYDDMGFS